MKSEGIDAWLAKHVSANSAELFGSSDPKPVEPDRIDSWLTQQLQDDPTGVSPDSPTMARTAVQFLDPFEASIELLKKLTGVEHVSLRPDDGSDDGDPRLRPWRLRHALQGLHHGVLVLPWVHASRLVHAARLQGLTVRILRAGVGSPAVPDGIALGALGLPEPLVAELEERGATKVGQLRQMPKDALQELDFPSTVLAGVRGLRGEGPDSAPGAIEVELESTLNPWDLLNAAAVTSLWEAAQLEVRRRLTTRLPSVDVDTNDSTTPEWVQAVGALEHRRIRIELAMRVSEVVELIAPVAPMPNVGSWERP